MIKACVEIISVCTTTSTYPLTAVADMLLMLRLIRPKLSVKIPPSRIPMLSRKLSNAPTSLSGINGRIPGTRRTIKWRTLRKHNRPIPTTQYCKIQQFFFNVVCWQITIFLNVTNFLISLIFTEQRQLNGGWNLSLGYKPSEDIRIQGFCNVSAVNCYFVPKTFSNNYITIFKNIIKGFHDNPFHMLFNYNPANLCHSYLFSYFNVLTVLLWFYKLVTLYQAHGTFGQNTG